MKKVLFISLCVACCVAGLLWWHYSPTSSGANVPATAASVGATTAGTNMQPASAQATAAQSVSREMDLNANPYAAGLRESGKSKREWDAAFIKSFQQDKTGDSVRCELTGGVMAEGTVKI